VEGERHLWTAPTHAIVDKLNVMHIDALHCAGNAIVNVFAQHSVHVGQSSVLDLDDAAIRGELLAYIPPKTTLWGVPLQPHLSLALGARVKLLTTLDLDLGLVNGATGTVHAIVNDEADGIRVMPGSSFESAKNMTPALPIVLVQMDVDFYDRPGVVPHEARGVVPIACVEQRIKFKGVPVVRTALPLGVAAAGTVHAAQGVTCDVHVMHPPGEGKKNLRARFCMWH
jgi:hypothetical protein